MTHFSVNYVVLMLNKVRVCFDANWYVIRNSKESVKLGIRCFKMVDYKGKSLYNGFSYLSLKNTAIFEKDELQLHLIKRFSQTGHVAGR